MKYNDQIYRLPEVLRRTQLSKSTIYNFIANGTFPPPVRLGPRAVGWSAATLQEYFDTRPQGVRP